MLKNIISLILLSLLILASDLYAQKYFLLGDIKYGSAPEQLGNDLVIESGNFFDLIPGDLEIDLENNIYVCDKFSRKIFKFTSELDLIYEQTIDDKFFNDAIANTNYNQFGEKILYQFDLETDILGNLYVLISATELYVNLLKYDKYGNLMENFSLDKTIPNQYLRDFFISGKNKIFINTFPFSPQDVHYINEGPVFVYDLDGNFLGRTDYFIEDKGGNVYKRNLLNPMQLQIDAYNKQNGQVVKTTNLELIGSIKIDYSQDRAWHFLGVDKLDNIYFTHGQQNVLVRKFNFSDNTIEDVKIEEKDLKNLGVLFANNFNNISLSPDGNIFLCGIRNSSREKSLNDRFSIDDVLLTIITLNY